MSGRIAARHASTSRGSTKVVVIPNPVSPPPLDDREALRERHGLEGRTLVFAGRLVPQKAIDVALDAVVANPDVSLVLAGECELRRKGTPLQIARRVIVVIVETALADCDRTTIGQPANCVGVARGIEVGRVVWMDTGGEEDEAGMSGGERRRAFRGGNRLADRDQRQRAGQSSAVDRLVAIRVERRIGEMDVTIDECRHRR